MAAKLTVINEETRMAIEHDTFTIHGQGNNIETQNL